MPKLTKPEERAQRIVNKHFVSPISVWKEYAAEEIGAALKELVEVAEKHGQSLHTAHVAFILIKGLVNEMLPEDEKL